MHKCFVNKKWTAKLILHFLKGDFVRVLYSDQFVPDCTWLRDIWGTELLSWWWLSCDRHVYLSVYFLSSTRLSDAVKVKCPLHFLLSKQIPSLKLTLLGFTMGPSFVLMMLVACVQLWSVCDRSFCPTPLEGSLCAQSSVVLGWLLKGFPDGTVAP